jgi:hypothetical protein
MPSRVKLWVGIALLLAGCDDRERLTFPSENPGTDVGPVTTIDHPAEDSVITEGDLVVVAGRTVDPNGVDTVYFEVDGGSQTFLPFAAGGEDTVTFGLPITTIGFSGVTISVRVVGVDLEGHRGSSVSRRLSIE